MYANISIHRSDKGAEIRQSYPYYDCHQNYKGVLK